ncbi:MAG: hypothetical protein HY830_06405 [Actinobacteria bacterium]|nr:hypothetical protein [Actinomycetota bacterium]
MRRRLALLLGAVLAATTVALVPIPAQAAELNGGALAADVTTTAILPGESVVLYTLAVPAGARPTITLSSMDAGLTLNANLSFANNPEARSGNSVSESRPLERIVEFTPYPDPTTEQPAELRLSCGCSVTAPTRAVTFTLHYAVDTVQTVQRGELVELAFTEPGQRAWLTVPGDYYQVSVFVPQQNLTAQLPVGTLPKLRVNLLDVVGSDLTEVSPGHFVGQVPPDQPMTVVVDPTFDHTGSLQVRINAVPRGTGVIEYGAPDATQLSIGQPQDEPTFFLETRTGADTLVHVLDASLQHPDGTPGALSLELDVPGSPAVVIGTVRSGRQTFTVPEFSVPDVGATLRLVNDGETTGFMGVRVRLDPGAATPVTLGATTSLSLPPGQTSVRYSVAVEAQSPVELYFGPASYGDPSVVISPVTVESSFGERYADATLSSTAGTSTSFSSLTPGRFDIVLTDPSGSGLSVDLRAVRGTTVTQEAQLPFEADLTIGEVGQNQAVLVALAVGQKIVATVTDETLSGSPSGEPAARLSFQVGDGGVGQRDLQPGGAAFLEITGDGSGPTLKIVIDGNGLATGTVHLKVGEPAAGGGPIAAGVPTTVTVDERGALARYTFDGAVGDRVALTVSHVAFVSSQNPAAEVFVVRPDGSLFAGGVVSNGGSGEAWIEAADPLDAAGSWTIVVDPFGDTTGSLTLTRLAPRTLTSALTVGKQETVTFDSAGDVRRLTFKGTAGQRVLVEVSARTVGTRMRMISETGLVITDDSSFLDVPYVELGILPSSGTWTLELDPTGTDVGTVTLTVGLVRDPVRTIEVGARVTSSFTKGQNPLFRFQVRAGQRIGVAFPTVSTSSGGTVQARLLRPDGSLAWFDNISSTSFLEMPLLADTGGRWSLVLDADGPATGRATFTVWTATDQVQPGRLGRTTNVEVKEPVQNVVLPFDVTADGTDKFVHYTVTGSRFAAAQLTLMTPFGSPWQTIEIPAGDTSGTFGAPLFFDGTWQLVVDPQTDSTGKAKVTFTVSDTF